MRKSLEAVSQRIYRKLVRRFPIGARVCLNRAGIAQLPRYAAREATVLGYYRGIAPKLLWDGRKKADSYSVSFLRVRRAEHSHG